MIFTDYHNPDKFHIDYIAQGNEADTSWISFIPGESHGFTHVGVERIYDSIRTQKWAVLGR